LCFTEKSAPSQGKIQILFKIADRKAAISSGPTFFPHGRQLGVEHNLLWNDHDVGFKPTNRSAFRDLDVGIENRSRYCPAYGDRTFLLSSRIR
jgi:hypothetical protein